MTIDQLVSTLAYLCDPHRGFAPFGEPFLEHYWRLRWHYVSGTGSRNVHLLIQF